jgi:hypothetical protein
MGIRLPSVHDLPPPAPGVGVQDPPAISGEGGPKLPRKECLTEGCVNGAARQGMCVRHGTKRTCKQEGCTTNAQTKGLCYRHGGGNKSTCTKEINGVRCTTNAAGRNLCVKHGGYGICKSPGCNTNAQSGSAGLCCKHGGGGGGGRKTQCTFAGCTTMAQARHLCVKHGAFGVCTAKDCTNKAKGKNLCPKHKE